jgi:PIN domain nuclease of toxin-antitoxin system
VKLLLDTHIVMWAARDSPRLSAEAAALILDTANDLAFSVASLWEISIKAALGRADFQIDIRSLRRRLLAEGYREYTIEGEHAAVAASLPLLHKDPFDRMLVAQAVIEGVVLLTSDPVVARYPGPIRLV